MKKPPKLEEVLLFVWEPVAQFHETVPGVPPELVSVCHDAPEAPPAIPPVPVPVVHEPPEEPVESNQSTLNVTDMRALLVIFLH